MQNITKIFPIKKLFNYLTKNLGTLFLKAFIVVIFFVIVALFRNYISLANSLMVYGYIFLVLGVIFQLIILVINTHKGSGRLLKSPPRIRTFSESDVEARKQKIASIQRKIDAEEKTLAGLERDYEAKREVEKREAERKEGIEEEW